MVKTHFKDSELYNDKVVTDLTRNKPGGMLEQLENTNSRGMKKRHQHKGQSICCLYIEGVELHIAQRGMSPPLSFWLF